MSYIKPNKKWDFLVFKDFHFPAVLSEEDLFFTNEDIFLKFLLKNEWLLHRLGLYNPQGNGSFPDLICNILGSNDKLKIEIEYDASNYNHPFGKCDLILSFIRKFNKQTYRGVQVWSFYKWDKKSKRYFYCLDDDIKNQKND